MSLIDTVPVGARSLLAPSRLGSRGPLVLVLAVVVVVAVVSFVVDLASSSLFVDEVLTWRHASGPLGRVLMGVRVDEVNPPAYFFALNVWTHVFGDSVFALRLPSALAAGGTVAAVAWLAYMLGGRVAALASALLLAASPVVLEYAQQARPYASAMLAVTLAVGCTLRYLDAPRDPGRWLAGAIMAAVAAVWIHYTAWFVIVPLAAWVLTRRLGKRLKATFVFALLLAFAVTAPLLRDQLAYGHHQGAVIQPASLSNIARVLGTPYDRLYNVLHLPGQITGAILVLVGVVLVLFVASGLSRPRRLLVAALALTAPVLIVAIATLAQHAILFHPSSEVVISRYTAVAAPFMIVALACGVVALPRPLGALLGAGAMALAISGSVQSHESSARYPDIGAAMRYVAGHWRPGDVLLAQGYAAVADSLEYYRHQLLPASANGSAVRGPTAHPAPRVWTVGTASGTRAQMSAFARAAGYRLVTLRDFPVGVIPIRATLSIALPPGTAEQRASVTRTVIAFELAAAGRNGGRACELLTPRARAATAQLARAADRGMTCAAGIAAEAAPGSGPPRAAPDVHIAAVEIDGDRATATAVIAGHVSQVRLRYLRRHWLIDS